jgi:branched-subunit amino acid transport protein
VAGIIVSGARTLAMRAGVLAALVAWRARNVGLILAAGLAILMVLQRL